MILGHDDRSDSFTQEGAKLAGREHTGCRAAVRARPYPSPWVQYGVRRTRNMGKQQYATAVCNLTHSVECVSPLRFYIEKTYH